MVQSPSQSAKRPVFGIILVVISAIAMATVPIAAKLAFEAGSNILTVVAVRGSIGVALMGLLIAVSGQSFRIGRETVRLCLVAGLLYAMMSFGFIGSVSTIPVSLAVLIFFTHPILIAIVSHYTGGDVLTRRKFALAILALFGVGVALGQEFSNLDPTGIALAAVASVGFCFMVFLNARAQKNASNEQVSFYTTAMTPLIFASIASAQNAWVFPVGPLGWIGLIGAALGITIGLLTFFASFRHIGPVRATMISNIEPLMSILLAVVILGEQLRWTQWIGVAIVIAALLLLELPQKDLIPDI